MNDPVNIEPTVEPGTLDRIIRFASEDLARSLDRRSFLKRASTGAFLFMAAVATGRGLSHPAKVSAAESNPLVPPKVPLISCSPPGPYCNNGNGALSGCNGAHCFDHLSNGQLVQCRLYYTYYPGGCWTSGSGSSAWTCCDCQCTNGVTCGCAQLSGTPSPLPFAPDSKGH
ncbi:MAG: hypothetical protein M3Z04_22125 [Chloroflexota bacterium]|nr:hypothetical protein [Chloroflexota bacterium]